MSRQSINYALHTPAAWPASRADDADEVIRLRGELSAALAQLDAANERARAMAADLSRVAVINAGQASIIWTQAHELDALRNRRHLTLTDRGDAGDGYGVTL